MNKVYRKLLCCFSFCMMLSLGLYAQQNHFIYLQTENKQPFYIKLDKKIFSSSVSGYLIIPKLQDGSYELTVGFPKNEWPEQKVTCSVNKKDVGYLLKRFGDKGWGLFNLQTMEVITSGIKPVENKEDAGETKTDIFSNTLSAVVNDPSIAKKTEEEEKTVIKEEVQPAIAIDNKKEVLTVETPNVVSEPPAVTKKPEEIPTVKGEIKPVIPLIKKEELVLPAPAAPEIKKLFSVKSTEGADMVYVDIVNGQPDTIRIFIPAEKKSENAQVEKKAETLRNDEVSKAETKKETKPIEIVKEEAQKTDPPKNYVKQELPKAIEPAKKETVKVEVKKEDTKPVELVKEEPKVADPVKDELKKEQSATNEIDKKEKAKTEVAKVEPKKKEVAKKESKKAEQQSTDPKFIDIELPNPNKKTDTVLKQTQPVADIVEKTEEPVKVAEKPKESVSKPLMINSDCKSFASEDDFLKLRKKMAAETKNDDMVNLAKKAFRSKCFTTAQVKNLSVLFLTDEGKYKFFDSAYPFVSDSSNFGTLESQLTDDYFITRFKAMIRH